MTNEELKKIICRGEDSRFQFKEDITNANSLASEMAAFSNGNGGSLIIGVTDKGEIPGLTRERIGHLNQLISNSASQCVHPPLNPITEIIDIEGKFVLIVSIQEGILKPYMDNLGVVWVKSGADKRRVTSREELQRCFAQSKLIHGDEISVPNAGYDNVDKDYFKKLYQKVFEEDFSSRDEEIPRFLENMKLANEGNLKVAGALLVAKEPNFLLPVYMVKAVCYPGNDIHVDTYNDTEDISGRIETQFKDAIAFILRNLRRVQAGQNVNSVGKLEIPKIVLEEIVANALIHRDYFYSAPVRIFVFSDRIEIISPGALPDNLTVDMMKYGVSNPRNTVLSSFASKVLVYKGLGNGVRRALKEYPYIDFDNNTHANQFKVTIKRVLNTDESFSGRPEKSDQKKTTRKKRLVNSDQEIKMLNKKIIEIIVTKPTISRKMISEILGKSDSAIKRRLEDMVAKGIIKRVGPNKGGRWEVIDNV